MFRAALLRVGAIDVTLLATTMLPWSWFGIVELRIALPLHALRIVAWVLHLRQSLEPARACGQGLDALGDEELLRLDTALQANIRQFVRAYGMGLFVAFGGSTLLAWLGVVPAFVLPRAEIVALTLLTLAVVIAAPEIPRGAIDLLVSPTQSELARVLGERDLGSRRAKSSALRIPIQAAVLFITAILLGLGGLTHYMEVRGLRKAAGAEQRLIVERAASATGAGLDQAGVRVVSEAELPPDIQAELASGEPLPTSLATYDPRRDLVSAAAPLPDGSWALAEGKTDEQLGIFFTVLVALIFGAVPLIIAAMYFNMRRISAPLEALTELAERFALRGELRSLERLYPGRHDELGQLATNFNAMLDNLEQLTDAAESIAAGNLAVKLDAPGQLHDAFRAMLDHLANSVTRLRVTALEVASAASEIEAFTNTQADAIDGQAAAVHQTSETVSSLAASAAQIAGAAQEVLVDAEQAATTTEAASEQIRLLREQTASIEGLLDLIRDIADRSDLLALNGSLEATRAGEAGRGFALVAAEMRRLAERVTAVVTDVRGRLTAIESAGASAVSVTEDNRRIAGETAHAAQTISSVTAQQSIDTEQVAEGMVQLADAVINATRAVSQTRAAAIGLREVADELEQLTRDFELPGGS